MQIITAKELSGFQNEFELTCAAQDGDGKAWLALWNHYKKLMMSRLVAVKGISREELESEAIEVFAHKLENFCREKVKSEDAFSMFSWLFCGAVNKTDKLIRQRKKDVHLYFEKVNAAVSGRETTCNAGFSEEPEDDSSRRDQMLGINNEIYTIYNPEKMVVAKLHDDDTKRVKAFYARLSQFEKDILEARREGLTLAQVAKRFQCSVTTVKNHVRRAKLYASDIFEVCYA
jgi:RNA polymerase sigma factor (sigma-70 family)